MEIVSLWSVQQSAMYGISKPLWKFHTVVSGLRSVTQLQICHSHMLSLFCRSTTYSEPTGSASARRPADRRTPILRAHRPRDFPLPDRAARDATGARAVLLRTPAQ